MGHLSVLNSPRSGQVPQIRATSSPDAVATALGGLSLNTGTINAGADAGETSSPLGISTTTDSLTEELSTLSLSVGQFQDDSAGADIPVTPSPDNSAGVDIPGTPPNHTSIEEIVGAVNEVFGGDLAYLITQEALSPGERTMVAPTAVEQAPPPVIRRSKRRPNDDHEGDGAARRRVRRRLGLENGAAEGSTFAVPPGGAARTTEIALSDLRNEIGGLDSTEFFPPEYQAPQSLIGTEWYSSDEEAST